MEGRKGIARVDGLVRLLRGRRQHIAGDSSRRLRPAGPATVAPTTTAGMFTTWPTSYHSAGRVVARLVADPKRNVRAQQQVV